MKDMQVDHNQIRPNPWLRLMVTMLVLCGGVAIVACGGDRGHEHHHDHSHDHDHDADHHHHHDPPHGGAMAALGDHFAHIEVVINPTNGKLSVYLLDGEAVHGIRIAAPAVEVEISHRPDHGDPFEPFSLSLEAIGNPITGEQPGDTSEFEGKDDRLIGLSHFHVKILSDLELKGQSVSGVEFDYPEGADE